MKIAYAISSDPSRGIDIYNDGGVKIITIMSDGHKTMHEPVKSFEEIYLFNSICADFETYYSNCSNSKY